VTDTNASGIGELTAFLDQHRDRIPERVALMALLADLHLRTTDLDRAEALITAAAELAADVGVPSWDDAGLARTRGVLHLRRNDAGRAVEVARRALEDPGLSARGRARLHDVIGIAQSVLGDLQASADAFEDELACASAAGLDALLATIHANLAESYLQLGAQRIAAHHQQIALDLSRQQGQPVLVAFSLMIAARLVAVRQRARDAVVLQTKADDLLAAADYALYDEDARVRDLLLGEAAARLGAAGYGAAVTAARATSAQCVADLAAEILASVGSAPATNRGGT
jgi:hypothetical protein